MFNAEIKKNDAPKCCKRVVGCISQWQQSFSEGPDKKKLCCYKHALSGRNGIPISGWIELIYLKEASRNKEDLGLQLVWKSHMWRPCTGSSVPSPSIISLLGKPLFCPPPVSSHASDPVAYNEAWGPHPNESSAALTSSSPLLPEKRLSTSEWFLFFLTWNEFWGGSSFFISPSGFNSGLCGANSPIPSWLYNRECKQLSFIVLCPEPYLPVSCFK